MKNVFLKNTLISLISGVVCTFSMDVPFIGVLIGLLAFPLMDWYPELGKTGEHVDVGFAWLVLKSNFAKIAFSIYFFALSMFVVNIWYLIKERIKKQKKL